MSESDYSAYKAYPALHAAEPAATRPAESVARAEGGASASPLRSQESFDAYCRQVQTRLAEHAAQRATFLRAAYERLTRLLHTARAVEDTALYNELWQHRIAVRELLESLTQASTSPGAWPSVPPPSKPVPLQAANGHFTREVTPTEGTMRSISSPPPIAAVRTTSAPEPPQPDPEPLPRLPRHPVRPLIDIEADAVRLRGELHDWNNSYPLRRPSGEINIPNALKLRAMACRQRRLEEEAGDTEVAEVTELNRDLVRLLDEAGDQEYTVALDYQLDPRPTAFQWAELAERHEETARAQEAFEWWLTNRSILTVADVQPLAEAVAAIQQRFNRLLFRIGARDPFQQQLFDDLRSWAKEAQCYLFSLRPKVPIAELVEKASGLEAAWEQARIPVHMAEQRQKAVDDLIAMVSESNFGEDAARDEERLHETLLRCREAHVPASDRRLRDALLPWASFLEGDDRFKETLREIHLEWERRQEAGKAELVEDEPDNALDSLGTELDAVRAITRGKRCLLLGGTCREENRRKIEQALELEELVWPSTKPSDPLSRFETEIRHSDIVALLTRFSRKEWKNAADLCARDGKKFVHLTTGYGVAQVVHHFYNQIAPEAVGNRS